MKTGTRLGATSIWHDAGIEIYLDNVQCHWRDDSGEWQREEIVGEGTVPVPCLDGEITLDTIYHRVERPAVGEPEPVEYES